MHLRDQRVERIRIRENPRTAQVAHRQNRLLIEFNRLGHNRPPFPHGVSLQARLFLVDALLNPLLLPNRCIFLLPAQFRQRFLVVAHHCQVVGILYRLVVIRQQHALCRCFLVSDYLRKHLAD